MGKLDKCPKCGSWLMYDYRDDIWYCECGYEEQQIKTFKKFRKELD